jgi:hypothetical protein
MLVCMPVCCAGPLSFVPPRPFVSQDTSLQKNIIARQQRLSSRWHTALLPMCHGAMACFCEAHGASCRNHVSTGRYSCICHAATKNVRLLVRYVSATRRPGKLGSRSRKEKVLCSKFTPFPGRLWERLTLRRCPHFRNFSLGHPPERP